ncbi:hypothetical protein PTKIN_Ptkin14bG0209000 [Pterospermum kingtungense]
MADDVLPNMTLRDTITRILNLNLNQRGDTSSVNAGSGAANLKRKLDSGVAEQSMKKIRVGSVLDDKYFYVLYLGWFCC